MAWTGMVTGMEAMADGLSSQAVQARATWRAVENMMRETGMAYPPPFACHTRHAHNQDALIAEVKVDSSAWTGRIQREGK